ncbi:MAG: Asp-tRNA(Asn)/Glu-tRNA(Gln) amidotransferase subunit GatC [Gammaproteobacteria bacterium]
MAHLARLHIDDDAVDRYTEDLSSILELMEQMNQVDSSGVEPLSNPLDATQRLRDDEVTESDQRDKFQAIAPDVSGGFYRVPKVIE